MRVAVNLHQLVPREGETHYRRNEFISPGRISERTRGGARAGAGWGQYWRERSSRSSPVGLWKVSRRSRGSRPLVYATPLTRSPAAPLRWTPLQRRSPSCTCDYVGHPVSTSAHTVLPPASSVQPHRVDRASTTCSPRPRLAPGSCGCNRGGSVAESRTSTRTDSPAMLTVSCMGARAWSMAFDKSSVTTSSVGSPASAARSHSVSTRVSCSRAERAALGGGVDSHVMDHRGTGDVPIDGSRSGWGVLSAGGWRERRVRCGDGDASPATSAITANPITIRVGTSAMTARPTTTTRIRSAAATASTGPRRDLISPHSCVPSHRRSTHNFPC